MTGLGKQYRIGASRKPHNTLRDALSSGVAGLAHSFGRGGQRSAEDTIWALKDMSFNVMRGEVVGVIGRNGAGKSTLLKILSRITEPTCGEADIYGRVGSLLEVGTGFHSELTGRENTYLNGAVLGMQRREVQRKFDAIVAFAAVEKFIDTPVKHYSSGMYMRLAFAVAAHLEPEILLVDEVLAVGDAEFQKKCLGKMSDVAREGRTVLFVSHNLTAIKSLCPTALLLDMGRLVCSGNTAEVVNTYANSGPQMDSNRVWSDPQRAPGNALVRIKSAVVVRRTQAGTIDVHTPVDIEFQFWNFQAEAELNYSLVLYTHEEICVLNTASEPKRYSQGIVQGTCHIPGDFLNAATYRVRILVVQNSQAIFDDADVLSFEVTDPPRTGNWFGEWIGVVRPKFEWTTMQVPSPAIVNQQEI